MRATQIVLFIILSCNLSSCSKKQERSSSFITPLRIEISSILADDPEIVEAIAISEKYINEFSDNIETIAIKGELLIYKDEDSLSIIDGLQVAKIMLDFYSNNTQLQNTIEEFEEFINTNKNLQSVDDLQIEALSLILLEYKHRVNLLKHKHQAYYKK